MCCQVRSPQLRLQLADALDCCVQGPVVDLLRCEQSAAFASAVTVATSNAAVISVRMTEILPEGDRYAPVGEDAASKKSEACMNRTSILVLGFGFWAASCAPVRQGHDAGGGMVTNSNASAGYLTKETVPVSLDLLPPPPTAGSPALALDEEIHKAAAALRDTPRYRLAALDAELIFPHAADAFACTLGVPIDEQHTPHLYRLMQRILLDAGTSTASAKNKYMRARPFMVHEEPSCRPEDEARLRTNGSYPSGHTTIGWAWALALAEVDPSRHDAIIARGRAYGESRLVCNVHWQSDIIEGRFLGAAVVSQEHGVAEFRADVEAARHEVAEARANKLAPSLDCAAEAEALTQKIPGVL
jgi:acid phosphatase (class A)